MLAIASEQFSKENRRKKNMSVTLKCCCDLSLVDCLVSASMLQICFLL